MTIYKVELSDGYWQVDTDTGRVPLRNGGQPVATFAKGWTGRFVYTGFAPVYLFELARDDGNLATWYLNENMDRIGGELPELSAEIRAFLAQKYLELIEAPWQSLLASPEPVWPAAIEGLSDINHRTMHGLDQMARSGGGKEITWHDVATLESEPLVIDNGGAPVQVSAEHLKSLLSIELQQNFIAALKSKQLSWLSPVTGKPVTRVHSLYIDNMILLYRCIDDDSGLVFYVCCAGHHMKTIGVLFPTLHRAFYLTAVQRHFAETVCQNMVARITHYLSQSGRLLPGYFARPLKGFATPLWGGAAFHVGHHLWNELAGLMTMVGSVPPADYPPVIVQGKRGDGEAYGAIEALFPELSKLVIRGIEHDAAMVEFCCEYGLQIIRVTGNYVSKALRERIMALARAARGLDEERALASRLKTDNVPIVVLGLRVENRTVADPEAFCLRVVEYLKERFGRVAVVVDGHNSRPPEHGGESYPSFTESRAARPPIEVEKHIARSLQEAFRGGDVTIVDNIGGSMSASLFWLDQCDFFVAPWGAGLAKYRWAANKPGVVVSSKWVLENKGDLHIYDDPKYMEDPADIRFIGSEHVFDFAEEPVLVQVFHPHHPMYYNFKLNMRALYKDIDDISDQVVKSVDQVGKSGADSVSSSSAELSSIKSFFRIKSRYGVRP
jgi:hypothetical protein